MYIRWRGLELPSRVIRDKDVSTENYARFLIEPFEQGFGTTIGNALRRVLLSSLEGAAVTSVKIDGVAHEFTSIDGVLQDVTDIILNIKGICLTVDADEPRKMTLERNEAGDVCAGDIVADPAIEVMNPDHHIATLTADVPFRIEMTVAAGRGYATGSDNRTAESELGVIPVDSIFSPVLRVRYRTEDMRVGQRTNFDRLILEVWTNGTVSPENALVEAGLILRKHLNPFVNYDELGDQLVTPIPRTVDTPGENETVLQDILDKPVSILNLSVRASNCLEAAKTSTIGGLVRLNEADLLRFRSFGKTSLHEVMRKLAELGLSLGMKADEEPSETGETVATDVIEEMGGAPGTTDATGSSDAPGTTDESDKTPASNPSVPAEAGPMEAFTMGE